MEIVETKQSVNPIEILLVEDQPADAKMVEIQLEEAKVQNRLNHVIDGEEAISFLKMEGKYSGAPRPDLVLLDLVLPGIHGREVLQEIKGDERLKDIPVVILTTSAEDRDLLDSYSLQADCFLTKPFTFKQLLWVVNLVDSLGLAVVKR